VAVVLYTEASMGISIRVSPMAELAACLHALAEPDHHPLSRPWITSCRSDVDEMLLAQALTYGPLWGPVRARYLLPMTADSARSFDEELADIVALPLEPFSRLTAQALMSMTSRKPPPDVLNDRRARDDFLNGLQRVSWRRFELGTRLVGDPEGFREDLVRLLSTVHDSAFAHEWEQLHPVLLADVQRRRSDHYRRGLAVLSDFPAATELTDPPRVVFDKLYTASAHLSEMPCVLVPSRHVNPHLVIKHLPGLPVVIQYSVGTELLALGAEAVQRRLSVLHEPMRLAICRSILRRPMAGVELARMLNMTEPQVSRHLRRLREAGMVHRHREGAVVRYELDREAIRRLGVDLLLSLYR
jgi:DNA-binding transcriptional ArsR family regulator